MPEGAEVRHMSNCLNEVLNGKMCSHVLIFPRSRYFNKEFHRSCPLEYKQANGYKYVECGLKLNSVSSKGKKIIFDLGHIRFISSCLLHGHWSWELEEYTSIGLIFGDKIAFYSDMANEGYFSICQYPGPDYTHILKDVGPDLLTDEVTYEVYYAAIRNPRIKNKEICDFMMEQQRIAGIGNIYRADILFTCRIHPRRTLDNISDQEVYYLFYYSKVILFTALNSKGTTIQSYRDPNGNVGGYKPVCYGREITDEGYSIIKTEKDKNDRTIYFCPMLQR